MPIDHSESTMTKKREIAHCQRIHAQKLAAIRSRKSGTGTLDNTLPETAKMKHLKLKLKKLQLQEDRYNEIEHENKLLLQKMSRIITTHSEEFAPTTHKHGPSLNARARKWELMRVSKENKEILARLEKCQPTFDAAEWTAKRAEEEKWLRRLKKVHYKPPPGNLKDIARTEIKKLHQNIAATEPNEKVREIIGLSHSRSFYQRGHLHEAPPDAHQTAPLPASTKAAARTKAASPQAATAPRSALAVTAAVDPEPAPAQDVDAPLQEQASATADPKADETSAGFDDDFASKGEAAAASVASSEEAAPPAIGPPKVTEKVLTQEEKDFHDRKKTLYEVKQEIDIVDDDGNYCGSVLMAVEAKEKGGGEVEVTAKPLVEGETRVAPMTRLNARMPTIALVDPDAATSFAKAMVKGIKMKVEEDPDAEPEPEEEEDEGEEEEDDGAYEDEDEGMAASADAIQANARIAHPLPASRQRRRTSLFADSGKHVQPPVTEET